MIFAKAKALLYIGAVVALLSAFYWTYEQGRESGLNQAIAETQTAVDEALKRAKSKWSSQTAKVYSRERQLSSDLESLRANYDTLLSEVSHVQIVKPLREDRAVCADYNPLGDDFIRLFNAGAQGRFSRDSESPAHSGDGPVPSESPPTPR